MKGSFQFQLEIENQRGLPKIEEIYTHAYVYAHKTTKLSNSNWIFLPFLLF